MQNTIRQKVDEMLSKSCRNVVGVLVRLEPFLMNVSQLFHFLSPKLSVQKLSESCCGFSAKVKPDRPTTTETCFSTNTRKFDEHVPTLDECAKFQKQKSGEPQKPVSPGVQVLVDPAARYSALWSKQLVWVRCLRQKTHTHTHNSLTSLVLQVPL